MSNEDKQKGKSSHLERLIKAILANKALTLQLAERDADIQTLKQRLTDFEGCKGVEEYYAILCKSKEQQQEIQRLRGLYERERDIADEAQNEMERLRTVLTQIEDESSREDGCLTQINGMAQDVLSHQTEQPDTPTGPSKSSMGLMLRDDPQPAPKGEEDHKRQT